MLNEKGDPLPGSNLGSFYHEVEDDDGDTDTVKVYVRPSVAGWPLVDNDWDDALEARYNEPVAKEELAGITTHDKRREACHYSVRYLKHSLMAAAEIHSLMAGFEDLVQLELALLEHYEHEEAPPRVAMTTTHKHILLMGLHGRTRPLMIRRDDRIMLFKLTMVNFYWRKALPSGVFRHYFTFSN